MPGPVKRVVPAQATQQAGKPGRQTGDDKSDPLHKRLPACRPPPVVRRDPAPAPGTEETRRPTPRRRQWPRAQRNALAAR